MTMIDKIRQFPRIKWKPTIDAPKGEILLVLVRDGEGYYTELAYLNEFREWGNIPHLHKVMGWSEVASYLPLCDKTILDACCGGKMFYFDKHDPRVLFQDIRDLETTLRIWYTLVERNLKWQICPRKPSLRGGNTSSTEHYTQIGVICWPRDLPNVSEC